MTNKKRLLEDFLRYVQIDSESGNELEMCRQVERDLKEMGYTPKTVRVQGDTNGYDLEVDIEGDQSKEPFILCAHLDTVAPGNGIKPVVCEDGYIRSSGDTILAADDKSGVAAIMEALHTVQETGISTRPLQIFFTVGEEVGMWGARAIRPEILKAKYAAVFDTSKEIGRIVTASPGQLKLTATVKGVASHAGNAPEKGVSAILVAARALAAMKLQRIDEETTANIGTFDAVGATNIISPRADLVFEVRSRSKEKLYAQADHMVQCLKDACSEMGAELEYEIQESYLGYDIPDDHPVVKELMRCCESIGVRPFTEATGGGSDANMLNTLGITAVNVSTGMESSHTLKEQIKVERLEQASELILALMKG